MFDQMSSSFVEKFPRHSTKSSRSPLSSRWAPDGVLGEAGLFGSAGSPSSSVPLQQTSVSQPEQTGEILLETRRSTQVEIY